MEGSPNQQPNEEPEQQAAQAVIAPEITYTNEHDDTGVVFAAERVAMSAFRNWVTRAGLAEPRRYAVLNETAEKSTSQLNMRERQLVVGRADIDIATNYVAIVDPKMY